MTNINITSTNIGEAVIIGFLALLFAFLISFGIAFGIKLALVLLS